MSLAIVLWSSTASAQVNVEPLRKKVRDDGVSGSFEANATGRLGNVEGLVAGGMGQVGFADGRHLAFVHARGDYSRLNDRTQIARTFAHARHNLTLSPWLFGEAFAQVQTDRFLLLRQRELYGLGPRLRVHEARELQVFCGLAAMLEYERVNVPAGAPDPRETTVVRGSTYLAVTLAEGKEISFSAMGFFQPSLADPRDFRATLETSFEVAVRRFLSVRIYGSVRHDSAPVSTVQRTDIELRNALALTF
jgi:hypothetical protein